LQGSSGSSEVCYRCGNRIAPPKAECPKCGARQPTRANPPAERVEIATRPVDEQSEAVEQSSGLKPRLFAVPVHKFVVMTVCTFGIYQFYWAYFNWKGLNKRYSLNASPFWRAAFSGLWNFELFAKIRDAAKVEGVAVNWAPPLLAIAYLLFSASWQLPEPWWLLSQVSFLPLLPVIMTINALPSSRGFKQGYSVGNIAVILLGGAFIALCVAVWAFLPITFELP
jgi:hypothetical protein